MSYQLKHLLAYLVLVFIPLGVFGQVEICDNGIDDDFDNLIDLNDPDCPCKLVNPISLIPNPSFEDQDCCPQNRSELDCASNWIQASEPTTDYINTCGWMGWNSFPPPQPFPDGNGIMGFRDGRVRNNGQADPFWKEYAGACLLSPLLKDTTYRFQFDVGFVDQQKSPDINISFFGTTSCNNLPFGVGNSQFGCPTNSPDWELLGKVFVSGGGGNVWVNTFIEITPDKDIHAIAIGPDCPAVSTPVSLYYFFDNLILANIDAFDLRIKENEHPCSANFNLTVPNNPTLNYQWYLNGAALVGETSYELSQMYGEGDYQIRIIDGTKCRVSEAFTYAIPIITNPLQLTICEGESLPFGNSVLSKPGTYMNTFKSKDGCDSIVTIVLSVIGDKIDTAEVWILDGESFDIAGKSFQAAGDYPVTFETGAGCDSVVIFRVNVFTVYIPNAFSPNLDGRNDVFKPYGPWGFITSVEMFIYDRWGNQVHQGEEWGGTKLNPGVYVYSMRIKFSNGTTKDFHGDVTLVK